jgi:hypothetical protein
LLQLGLAMYVCYFFLFAALFYEKFLAPKDPKARCDKKSTTGQVCNATDASGSFMGESWKKEKKNDKNKNQ